MAELKEEKRPKPKLKDVFRATRRIIGWGYQASPRAMILLFICIVVVSVLPALQGYLNSRVIDELVSVLGIAKENRQLNTIFTLVGFVVISSILERTVWIAVTYFEKVHYFDLSRLLVMRFLTKASSLDMYHYENPASNSIIQKAKDIYDWKPREFLNRLFWLSADLIRMVTSMVIIWNFSLPAFLFVIATTVPGLIANVKLGEGSWGIWDASADERRRYWSSRDLLAKESSLLEIRIFRTAGHLFKEIEKIYDAFSGKEKHDQVRRSVLESLVGNLSTLGTIVFWMVAIIATLNGDITLGLLTFYTGSINRFSDALNGMFRNLSREYEDSLYLMDLFAFIDLPNKLQSGDKPLPIKTTPPLIEFKNVQFAYPGTDKLVLSDFSLTIEPGERIAFVGINGAGKTTIIKLLCRFYDVTGGQILIDGIDLREIDLDTWYKKVGVLFQSFVRYSHFTAGQNIELGNVDELGNKDHLEQAIYKADADTFIANYENKLDQILDKSFAGGIDPSGGQWQKIALARAFFRDAPILILDEPTSAIDAKAEYEIFERLYKYSLGKTVLIVSHRFSTVRNADKIYVISGGKVVESGSHEYLLQLNGKYAEAFNIQAKGYK